jgi:hypothetical protein
MVRHQDCGPDGSPWRPSQARHVGGWTGARPGAHLETSSYVAAREGCAICVSIGRRSGPTSTGRGRLTRHAADGGGREAILRPVVVLGDGGKWNWDEVASSFGGERTETVDWWHSAEHLWDLSKALHGEGMPEGRPGPSTQTSAVASRTLALAGTRQPGCTAGAAGAKAASARDGRCLASDPGSRDRCARRSWAPISTSSTAGPARMAPKELGLAEVRAGPQTNVNQRAPTRDPGPPPRTEAAPHAPAHLLASPSSRRRARRSGPCRQTGGAPPSVGHWVEAQGG